VAIGGKLLTDGGPRSGPFQGTRTGVLQHARFGGPNDLCRSEAGIWPPAINKTRDETSVVGHDPVAIPIRPEHYLHLAWAKQTAPPLNKSGRIFGFMVVMHPPPPPHMMGWPQGPGGSSPA